MKIISDLDQFNVPEFPVVTIGTFDGVHVGHQIILKKIVEEAKKNKGESVLITFWPHPRFILQKNDPMKLLSTFEEKVELITGLGVDYIAKMTFTPEFSNLSADEFVQTVLVNGIGTKKLFIGYDHHFGNNREGNIDFLKTHSKHYGFDVSEIPKQEIDEVGVSSTKIRQALADGDVSLANTLLGRPYSITGKVVHGDKRGRTIGFRTANLNILEEVKLLPKDGVYAVWVSRDGAKIKGMLNIGYKPTLEGSRKTIEVHLFNFADELYGENLSIAFIDYIRPEKKFDSLDSLKKQLEKDQKKSLKILR